MVVLSFYVLVFYFFLCCWRLMYVLGLIFFDGFESPIHVSIIFAYS